MNFFKKIKRNSFFITGFLFFYSCFGYRATSYHFIEEKNIKKRTKPYCYTSYFPYTVERPFYRDTKDELDVVSFLVLADSTLKITKKTIQLYLLKASDTIKLKELEPFEKYFYPNIVNEPELNVHFEYDVLNKATGSVKQIVEDFKLYRFKHSFRSVH